MIIPNIHVVKDLIGITQSDSARDPSLTLKLMTNIQLLLPTSNKSIVKSALAEQFVKFPISITWNN